MVNEHLTRRAVMAGAAGAACWAGFGTALGQSGAAPYPTVSVGRVMPRSADDYASAMMSGGPGKDGIPSIDLPKFWDAAGADDYLDPGDIVFGLVENGVARAYPQRILVWHEIVNDTLSGLKLAVTYCPLTGTAIAFERGDTEFGVSGRLVNSNLVMFDRATDTWFPQMLAIGIQGPYAGSALVERPIAWTTWQRWREAHPGTEVLSTETGFARNYSRDPYGAYNPRSGYYAPDVGTMFPLMNEDERFPPKSVVLGARTGNAAVAVPLDDLRTAGRLELDYGDDVFTALHDPGLDTGYMFRGRSDAQAAVDGSKPGGVSWSGGDALEPVNSFEAMWFAWAAFYPETTVHG